jgi:uncharacterized protein (DUF302 family)
MYPHVVHLSMSASAAIDHLKAALATERLNIVSEIDMQAMLQAQCQGWMTTPHRLLGIHSPAFASQLRRADPDFGALRPCSCSVREETPGRTSISVQEPLALALVTRNAAVCTVLQQASDALQRVLARLREVAPAA